MKNFMVINESIIAETEIKDLSDLFIDTDRLVAELETKIDINYLYMVTYCLGDYIVTYVRNKDRWLHPEHAAIIQNKNHIILQFGYDDYESSLYLHEFYVIDFNDKNNISYYDQDTRNAIMMTIMRDRDKEQFRYTLSASAFFSGNRGPLWVRFIYASKNLNKNGNTLSDKIYLDGNSKFVL